MKVRFTCELHFFSVYENVILSQSLSYIEMKWNLQCRGKYERT